MTLMTKPQLLTLLAQHSDLEAASVADELRAVLVQRGATSAH